MPDRGRHRARNSRHARPATWRDRFTKDRPQRQRPKPATPVPAPGPADPVPYDPPLIGPMTPPHRFPRNEIATEVIWGLAGELRTPAQAMRGNGGRW
ncbi:hypothetical protein GA0070558_108133 [Micromonospora haikouensis]|uniref:Uncharacterized protein n=1 Tax=Micromonospora haikouensis TaxID=686309 RepID=A0A1C4VE65_9ACTN|nr:hypothetical protein GA0070558_108133 [Micromonospora haikouensis]